MEKIPLWGRVIIIIAVFAVINYFVRLQVVLVGSIGFLLGMLEMYLTMHFSKQK